MKLTLHVPRLVGNPMEPKACVAVHDPAGEIYEIELIALRGTFGPLEKKPPSPAASPKRVARVPPDDRKAEQPTRAPREIEYARRSTPHRERRRGEMSARLESSRICPHVRPLTVIATGLRGSKNSPARLFL